MAQRVNTFLIDDLDGSDAAETVSFGLDNVEYEVDLSEEHATELRNLLGDYIEVARRVAANRARPGKPRSVSSGGSRVDREQAQNQREWARRQGFEISDRGRVPGWVKEKYEAAHQGSAA